jgi:tetratricopeptide (TPR) repeat protein
MTKKILIISIFILFQNYSFSQNNQIIDSLQTLLKTAKDDTNKVKLLIYISGEFSESNAVEAFKYNNQCLELISKLSHQKNSSYINEWLQLAACDIYALFVFTNLSVFHDPKKAMEYILKGLAISKKLTKSSDKKTANEGLHRLARSYFQMGNIFIGLEIDSSLKYYSKALPILLKIDDKELLSRVYEALASINIQKGNNEKGLEYMNSALVLAEYLQDKRNKAILYTNMGDVYLNEATTKKSKSSFYYTKCLEYYFKALKEASDDNNKKMQSAVLLNIALAYTEEKQFTLAKEYGLKSLALSKEINSKINSAEIYKYLSHIYAKSNDYKNAYMNHLAFSRINDSLTKIKITSSVSDVEIKYKKEKKNE